MTPRRDVAGTGVLLRFAVRRDRVRLPVWVLAGSALMWAQSTSNQSFYRTPAALAAYRASAGSNAASIAFSGPPVGLGTVAGTVAFEISGVLAVLAALMATSTVVRHTRADEEAGRTELLRAGRLGRHAPLLAATGVSAAACALLGAGIAAAAALSGLPGHGAVVLGAATASAGLVWTGATAVCAQLAGGARSVYGLVGGLLGVAFVVRALGDVTGDGASWASPLGWAQATHPWSDDRWWPLLLPLAAAALSLAGARALLDRRDLGAGFLQPRPGPATASRALGSPLGLAWRLQRGALLAWAVGVALLGLVYGGLAESVRTLLADNPDAQVFFRGSSTAELVDSYLGVTVRIAALLVTAYAVSATCRARTEEAAGRAEPLLAAAVGRARWLGSHLVVALGGATALLVLDGLATGASRAVATGRAGEVGRLTGAALGYVPAVWVAAGFAAALVGAVPAAAVPAAWTAFGGLLVVTLFADGFGWPAWVGDLSPLLRTPTVPAQAWSAAPLLALAAVAAGFLAVAFAAVRRRDVAAG
ncbi:ABC transporter permease [Modestobacter sp. NPDC049651]|uniref:ABC transporter permease n=1 Tax=unclassified Modestobacter TaxID=2643866 RepID=UPI003402AB6E